MSAKGHSKKPKVSYELTFRHIRPFMTLQQLSHSHKEEARQALPHWFYCLSGGKCCCNKVWGRLWVQCQELSEVIVACHTNSLQAAAEQHPAATDTPGDAHRDSKVAPVIWAALCSHLQTLTSWKQLICLPYCPATLDRQKSDLMLC